MKFALLGVVLGEIVIGLKRIRVVVARHVDAAPRVAVLVPRSSDIVVLLDDFEWNAGFLEPNRGKETAGPEADDQHGEARRHGDRVVERDGAGVFSAEVHLLGVEGGVVGRHRLAGDPIHHLPHHLDAQLGRWRAGRVPPGADGRQRVATQLGFLLIVEQALEFVLHEPPGLDGTPDECRITR